MSGREKDQDLDYEDQDSEPTLNAPGDAGPTGIGEEHGGEDESTG